MYSVYIYIYQIDHTNILRIYIYKYILVCDVCIHHFSVRICFLPEWRSWIGLLRHVDRISLLNHPKLLTGGFSIHPDWPRFQITLKVGGCQNSDGIKHMQNPREKAVPEMTRFCKGWDLTSWSDNSKVLHKFVYWLCGAPIAPNHFLHRPA